MTSTKRSNVRFLTTISLAMAVLACGRGTGRFPLDVRGAEAAPAESKPAPVPEPAPAPPASDPAKAATAWIDALRARDMEALARLSRFPFALRDTGTEGKCKNATVAAAAKLAAALACLIKDDLLHEDLKANPEPAADVLSRKTLPRWGRKWVREIPPDATPVSVFIHGNGNAFDMVLLVVGGGVQGLWKHATFERN